MVIENQEIVMEKSWKKVFGSLMEPCELHRMSADCEQFYFSHANIVPMEFCSVDRLPCSPLDPTTVQYQWDPSSDLGC